MRISYWSSDVCSSDLLSMTVCLSEPGDYQGGELVLDSDMKFAPRFKMPAGSALLYATSSIHRVEPVTAGERLVAITWIESRTADPFTRQLNADNPQILNLPSQDETGSHEIKSSQMTNMAPRKSAE